jgi:hypothetical protein
MNILNLYIYTKLGFSQKEVSNVLGTTAVISASSTLNVKAGYRIQDPGSRHGFIEGADLLFSPTNKTSDSKNAELFTKWIQTQLLPGLTVPSVIEWITPPTISKY